MSDKTTEQKDAMFSALTTATGLFWQSFNVLKKEGASDEQAMQIAERTIKLILEHSAKQADNALAELLKQAHGKGS